MRIDPQAIWKDLQAIKKISPLVHNITNYVVMEQTANSLLAIGASPVMAHALEEAADMTKIASSLVLNIGTLSCSWVQGMKLALEAANTKEIPVIFDPVGAGATPFRTDIAKSILNSGKISIIRGNASEILSLNGDESQTKGVDSPLDSSDHTSKAKNLAIKNRCIVWMSGKIDVITDGQFVFLIHNGHLLMSKVTGMGCTATALTGAFAAVNQKLLLACAHSAVIMGIVGEIAAKKASGPGSFKCAFIDALYDISLTTITEQLNVEVS